jgi:uncharacterized protein
VHGTITLDPCESAILGTRAYQRLRGVKHLGLASLVFPGADYSRFAHGLGTMHVTGLILDSLAANHFGSVTDDDRRLYRAAALLHDIGHYPFSHTFERALNDYYTGAELLTRKGDHPAAPGTPEQEANSGPVGARWLHEEVGRHVILGDPALRKLLDAYGIDAEQLTGIIERKDPQTYTNLVSSDLDADRIDYLMRTAKHTGLPYGGVALDYLLGQIRLDNEKRVCFSPEGVRAAEHMLLCRYFDYQQISFHNTVAGFELVLNDAIGVLLRTGAIRCTPDDIRKMISDQRWHSFDDAFIITALRDALDDPQYSTTDRLLFSSILDRNPPRLLVSRERLGSPSAHGHTLQSLLHAASVKLPEWTERFRSARFYLWKQSDPQLTKIGTSVPASVLEDTADEEFYDRLQQSIRILDDGQSSRPIQECGGSLMSVLSSHVLYSMRIYALLPREEQDIVSEIRSVVEHDLGPAWRTLFT